MSVLHGLISGCAIAAITATGAFAQDKIVLKYSSWFPASHSTNDVIKAWTADIEQATDGRVTVEYLPATVRTPREQFDAVTDGLADLVVVLPGYTPGRFPIMEAGELPLLVDTNEATLAPVFYNFYQQELAATQPFKGAHALTVFASAPTHLTSKPGPLENLGQIKGLKLRAPSATITEVTTALGAVTVQKPVTEMYELASQGIVDGTFFGYGPMISWKTADIMTNVLVMPGGFGQSVIAFLANEDKWASISEADRTAIMAVSGEKLATAWGAAWQNDEDVAYAKLIQNPAFKVTNASDAFLAEFKAAIAPVETAWVEKARAAGLADPAASIAKLREMLAAAKK